MTKKKTLNKNALFGLMPQLFLNLLHGFTSGDQSFMKKGENLNQMT